MNSKARKKKQSVRKVDKESGAVFLRDGVTAAFFLPSPIHEVISSIRQAFDEFLKQIPPDSIKWESIGASSEEWKGSSSNTIKRARDQLKVESSKKRRLTSVELADGDLAGDAPGYGFTAIGNPVDPELPDERTLCQMYFPLSVLDDVDRFVERIERVASLLPYVSGYVAPALRWAELYSDDAIPHVRSLAMKYPGYDVEHNVDGRMDINEKTRGARWITFLGNDLTKQLGGVSAIRKSLSSEISTEKVGEGLMIRAGDKPELGDRNRRVKTPLLCNLARLLEPVTLFNEPIMFGIEFGDSEDDYLERWERRFLD